MIVCKCGLHPDTYESMEAYFTKCEQDGLSYRQVFHNNPQLEQFRALAMRNRRRVCYDFAESIGATIRFRSYSKTTVPCKIANLVCETEASVCKLVEARADEVEARADQVEARADQVGARADQVEARAD